MKLRHFYLLLCLAGVVLRQLVPWVAAHGLSLSSFLGELSSTRVGGFFGMDVVVSAVALIVFASVEGRRLGMRSRWLIVLAILLVGVSLGLPLFLYLRERELDSTAV
jgi:hypothetical protein